MCRDNGPALRLGCRRPVRRTANSSTQDGPIGCTCSQLFNSRPPLRQEPLSRFSVVPLPGLTFTARGHTLLDHRSSGSIPMSRQPAAVTRSTLTATTAFRMSLVTCLLAVGSLLGLAGWEHQEGPVIGRVFRAPRADPTSNREISGPLAAAYALDRESGDLTLRCSQNSSTSHASSICSPILSNRTSRPPTEGLREDRPTQVRVDVRRWRTAILADGGRALIAGRRPNRRSLASSVPCPSPSLHDCSARGSFERRPRSKMTPFCPPFAVARYRGHLGPSL